MITKFKLFENEKDFNIGDKVLCIEGYQKSLYKNNIYEIEDVKRFVRHEYIIQFKLYGVEDYWDHNFFRKCTPKEIKKYELQNMAKKYNIG